MNIAQIQGVLAVSNYQNISRAAESLFLSQPALSLQISKLEAELGFPLFLRSAQGATLTPEGEAFCREAQLVADAWDRLQQTAAESRRQARAQLRISIGTRVFSNGLFSEVAAFFDRHPEIETSFITEAGGDYLASLESGALDAALDRLPPPALLHDPKRFYSCELIQEPQCVLCGADDPLAQRASLRFSDLQGCSLVTGLENSLEDRTMKETFRTHGVTPGRISRSDGIGTIMSIVAAGHGIALGPKSFGSHFSVVAIPLDPPAEIALRFLCLRERARDPALVMLRRHLQELCRRRKAAEP